eukprot:6198437-Pleurochrysis_carterae.AAC.7
MRHAADASRWPVRDEVAPLVAEHRGILFLAASIPHRRSTAHVPRPASSTLRQRESEERGRLGDGFSS